MTLDAMLAELAAAELACREYTKEAVRLEDDHGEDSYEVFQHRKLWRPLYDRREAAVRAISQHAIDWAAERARSFVTPANAQDPLVAAIDNAFAPLRRIEGK